MQPRIIAFDIGDKRIGTAVTDPFNEYAMPLQTYFRKGNLREDAAALAALAEQEHAGTIVCGLPLNADGTRSVQTEKTECFLEALKKCTSLPVFTEDERYTTREARGDLMAMGVSAKKDKRKKDVDSLAAAYILESYLAKIKKGETDMNMKEKETDYEEEEYVVELEDEEGVSRRYFHLATIEYKKEWYACFTPEEEEEEEDEEEGKEIVIFRIVGEDENEHFETVEDEALLDEVFAEFCKQYDDFEDSGEAALLEPNGEE